MKINFTKKEYRTLLELVFLGDWVLHSHEVEPQTARHAQLREKVFSYAKEMGSEDLVGRDEATGTLGETREFEEQMLESVEEYDSKCFWEELVARLADRDALAEVGEQRLAAMNAGERITLLGSKEDPWHDEFERHGIGRLVIRATTTG